MLLGEISWPQWMTAENLGAVGRIAALLLVGLPLAFLLAGLAKRALAKRFSEQTGMLVCKGIRYTAVLVVVFTVMNELGFHLTTILGAAGIAGVAIGFASQTSLSNLISGIFLISEKPFTVGDWIEVGTTNGLVLSIDLLSVKIRAFDNRFIRIPNETMLKTEVTNYTRFPIRRHNIELKIVMKEDIARVAEVLGEIARDNPYCLDEPEPLILVTGFGERGIEILFGVWFAKADFIVLRQTIMRELKERFDAEGIEIALPHRVLYAGSRTPPLPIRMVGEQEPDESPESGEPC